jgi:hypothetical protein
VLLHQHISYTSDARATGVGVPEPTGSYILV